MPVWVLPDTQVLSLAQKERGLPASCPGVVKGGANSFERPWAEAGAVLADDTTVTAVWAPGLRSGQQRSSRVREAIFLVWLSLPGAPQLSGGL